MAEYSSQSDKSASMPDQKDQDTQPTPGPDIQEWLSLIDTAQHDFEDYTRRCDKIRDRYLYESAKRGTRRRYQMLWSNQEILRPSVYAKRPNPSVESRFKDGNPVSRLACDLLERTLDFQFDLCDYDATFRAVRDDYLLYARGVPRVRYEPVFNMEEVNEGDDGEDSAGPTGAAPEEDGEPSAVLNIENVRLDFIDRKDFIIPFARRWEELPWICYRAFMDRQELIKRFPKDGAKIPLDSREKSRDDRNSTESATDKATVYEIWDKRRWRVMFIAKSFPTILEDEPPYLKLEGFYPSPKPAFGTLSTESLIPVPDFVFYQDQAEEIDDLTARIGSLTDSLKVVGFYPAGPEGEGNPEIERAAKPGFENKMVAVKAWGQFTQGGKDGVPVVWYPAQFVAEIIKSCVELRKQLIDDVFQITGISDIMRGDTEKDETAAAQGIKAQWGNIRLRERQKEIARVARDVTRLAAQIIANHFQLKTMLDVSSMTLPTDAEVQQKRMQFELQQRQYAMMQQHQGMMQAQQRAAAPGGLPGAPQAPGGPPQPPPGGPPQGAPQPQLPPPPQWQDPGPTQEQVEALLRDNVMRRYLIDIETDSTIAADEEADQRQRTEFIEQTGKFLVSFMPVVKEEPDLAPLVGALLKFGTRAFPVGRELEEIIDQTMDKIVAKAGQPAPPSPEQMKAQLMQAKGQAEMQRTQMDMRATQMRTQAEMQKAQLDAQSDAAAHQMDLQRTQMEGQQAAMEHGQAMQQAAAKQRTLEQQMQIAEQRAATRAALSAVGYGPRNGGGRP